MRVAIMSAYMIENFTFMMLMLEILMMGSFIMKAMRATLASLL
jgi:hypothetical protein